jgi:hypothetical protein
MRTALNRTLALIALGGAIALGIGGLASCSKSPGPASAKDSEKADIAAPAGTGIVLSPGARVYGIVEGKASVAGSLGRGEAVSLADPAEAPIEAIPERGSAPGKFRTFILPGGSRGYLDLSSVGFGAKAVLIGDKVPSFTEAKATKASGSYLDGASLVAASTTGVAPGFAAVTAYDAAAGGVVTAFVERKEVSTSGADIQAAESLARAAADPGAAAEILEKAAAGSAGSAFEGRIAAELARAKAANPAAEPVLARYEVSSDNVSLRDSADAVFGGVVGELPKGNLVDAVEIGAEETTVDGAKGRWVRIASPAGWVFDALLTRKD